MESREDVVTDGDGEVTMRHMKKKRDYNGDEMSKLHVMGICL